MSDEDLIWHGTVDGYSNHDCRCERCRQAWAGYIRKRRVERKQLQAEGFTHFLHGINGYREWKCRCDTCRKGASMYKIRRLTSGNKKSGNSA